MSQEPTNESPVTTYASSGAGWKWLAGAAVAAVLIGGGYYAWTNFGPAQSSTEVASNAPSSAGTSSAPIHAEPLPTQQAADAATSDTSASNSVAAPEPQTATATPVHRRAPSHAAAQVPEEVVGVVPASATTQDSEPIIVQATRRPVWAQTPSAWRLSTVYPERALESGREGEASVHCTVRNSGALDCLRVSETPLNAGFGNAALRVAHMFRHASQRADGSDAAGSPVNLRVLFRLADDRRDW